MSIPPAVPRLRADLAEVLPFGLLTLVVGALLVTNAWAAIDARMTTATAAREATRAYAEASDEPSAAVAARSAASRAAAGHGRHPERLRLDIDAPDGFARCAPVTIRTSYEVPALALPWIDGFGRSFTVSSAHTELVDPYRSGLAGAARC